MMQVSLIHQEEAFIQSVSPCGCLKLNDNQNVEKTFKSTFLFFFFSPHTSGEDSTSRVIRESIEESSACGCSRRPRTLQGSTRVLHYYLAIGTFGSSYARTEGIRLKNLRLGRKT